MNRIVQNNESRIRLSVVASETGKSLPTVSRWALLGIQRPDGTRLRLETVKVGRTLMSSMEALARFLTALSEQSAGQVGETVTPGERRRRAEDAAREVNELLAAR